MRKQLFEHLCLFLCFLLIREADESKTRRRRYEDEKKTRRSREEDDEKKTRRRREEGEKKTRGRREEDEQRRRDEDEKKTRRRREEDESNTRRRREKNEKKTRRIREEDEKRRRAEDDRKTRRRREEDDETKTRIFRNYPGSLRTRQLFLVQAFANSSKWSSLCILLIDRPTTTDDDDPYEMSWCSSIFWIINFRQGRLLHMTNFEVEVISTSYIIFGHERRWSRFSQEAFRIT